MMVNVSGGTKFIQGYACCFNLQGTQKMRNEVGEHFTMKTTTQLILQNHFTSFLFLNRDTPGGKRDIL